MKYFKVLFLGLVLSSCASVTKNTAANMTSDNRSPASMARFNESLASLEFTDLSQLSDAQIAGQVGKNLVRAAISCSLSEVSIVATAAAETVPVFSMLASSNSQASDKSTTAAVGGSVVAGVADLLVMGYNLIFMDNPEFKFSNAKGSYKTTVYLAKHFHSSEGECGKAGRSLGKLFDEIHLRTK